MHQYVCRWTALLLITAELERCVSNGNAHRCGSGYSWLPAAWNVETTQCVGWQGTTIYWHNQDWTNPSPGITLLLHTALEFGNFCWNNAAPCGLRGIVHPWFICWFWHYILLTWLSPLRFFFTYFSLLICSLTFSFENRPTVFPGQRS